MTIAQARTVLGLLENFSDAELKSQYRKKVLIAHPDRNSGDNRKFILVQQAFELLTKYRENSYYNPPNQQANHRQQNVYRERRNAEQAYKEKVHYYVKRKKTKQKAEDDFVDELKMNLKYFGFTVLILISFFLILLISFAFGVVGVIILLITLSTIFYRTDFKKFKF